MMKLVVFGTPTCPKCRIAVEQLQAMIEDRKLENAVSLKYTDVTTVEGMAESAFLDVFSVPTTILSQDDQKLGRWVGEAPPAKDVENLIQGQM